MWPIIIFLVKVIVFTILVILTIHFFYKYFVIPAKENGIDPNDLSDSDSQLAWALILIMIGGLCIALDAVSKIFGKF